LELRTRVGKLRALGRGGAKVMALVPAPRMNPSTGQQPEWAVTVGYTNPCVMRNSLAHKVDPVPSTYSVCLGNIERSTGLIDDGRHDPPHPHRPPPRPQDTPRPGAREPRLTAPTGVLAAHRAPSTAADGRPAALGPAIPPLEPVDGCRLRRPTRHGDPMAAVRLQALLDLEEPPERARPSSRRAGGPSAHPTKTYTSVTGADGVAAWWRTPS
jgi:hypothetical protein